MITIFTPTHNRAYILETLYDSLTRQTKKDFEWVIVDDGSVDGTEKMVKSWMNEKKVLIVYKKQKNQGKHVAINEGVKLARGELFFIVDSDDYLTDDAIEKISYHWRKYGHGKKNVSGILSYRKFHSGKIVGKCLPENVRYCTLRESQRKYGATGDKVVIYRTNILKKYPFPQFENERFLGESYVFNQIDDNYTMTVMHDAIYWFAYQKDGLSQNFRELYRNNPNGFYLLFEQDFKYQNNILGRIKCGAHLDSLSLRLKKIPFKNPGKGYRIMAFPLGVYLYIRIFILKLSDVKPYTEEGKQ